jgi:hypothetical protein
VELVVAAEVLVQGPVVEVELVVLQIIQIYLLLLELL